MEEKISEYIVQKGMADNTELEAYRKCFEENGTIRDLKNFQWLHQQNLANKNTIYYAKQENEIAGIYTALPVPFMINHTKEFGLQSIDTLTDVKHRGKGLFPKLAKKLLSDAEEEKYILIYGFPNRNSAPGLFNKLQWTSFGEVPFLLKPINYFYFIKRFFKSEDVSGPDMNFIYDAPLSKEINKTTQIKMMAGFDGQYNEIWEKASENINICVDRNAAYMQWRYVTKPCEHYYRYGLFVNGKLEGVVVYAIKKKHRGIIAYLMELIYDPQNPTAGTLLLKFVTNQCKSQKIDVILAWSLPHSFSHRSFKNTGYYNLPEKLRPQKLFFGAKALNRNHEPEILNINNWYISYSDSDTS